MNVCQVDLRGKCTWHLPSFQIPPQDGTEYFYCYFERKFMCLSEPVIFFFLFFFPSIFIIALDFLFLSAVSTKKVLKVIFNKCPKLEPSVALKGLLSSALSALSLSLSIPVSPLNHFVLGGSKVDQGLSAQYTAWCLYCKLQAFFLPYDQPVSGTVRGFL